MSGFALDWLTLREPFDRKAREQNAVAAAVQAWRAQRAERDAAPLSVMDLACGSGANLRVLAPLLGGAQRWRLVDHDPALLAAVPGALSRWADDRGLQYSATGDRIAVSGSGFFVEVVLQQLDLARELHQLPLTGTDLVTASALLDLVSAPWLETLLNLARTADAALLFALSVDGRIAWQPSDPLDAAVQQLFAAHQRRDKGFGPALGETAVPLAARLARDAGHVVTEGASDWLIDGADGPSNNGPAMLRAMVDGLCDAALEQWRASDASAADGAEQELADWRVRRQASLHATRLRVGHVDLFAVPRAGG